MSSPSTPALAATSAAPGAAIHPETRPPLEQTAARLSAYFRKQPQWRIQVIAIILVVIIGIIDTVTGYEITVFIVYTIPILFAVWYGDRTTAMLVAVLSALAWWGADVASGHVYQQGWVREWDATARLIYFVFSVVGGSALKKRRKAIREHVALLEHTQQLERQIIAISDRERERVGRDLHDGICQHLAAIGFAASSLKRDLEEKAPAESEAAAEIAALLKDAVVQTRDLARGLSPVERDEGGLESALEELAASATHLLGIHCSLTAEVSHDIADNTRDLHLFRIAQEALNNATKHGHATHVVINLLQAGPRLVLQICDDGIGFAPEKVHGAGIGLSIMEYRARTIGGVLEIRPGSPTGMIVSCTVPIRLGTLSASETK